MKSENKAKRIYIIGTIIAAILTIAAVIFGVYSGAQASKTSELGIDPKENVTKIYSVGSDKRIAGLRNGEIYAVSDRGEKLWSAGILAENPIYDITEKNGIVYAVFQNGKIISFSENDALNRTENDDFSEKCKVYAAGDNIDGNVSNTSLIVSEDGKTVYLRAAFRVRGQKNRIYAFDAESGEKTLVAQSARKLAGSALGANELFYSDGSKIMKYVGGETTEIIDIEEQITAVSAGEGFVAVITDNNNIIKINKQGGDKTRTKLGVALNGNYVFSTGENFVAKINNGGVAVINSESMKVTLSMNAEDSANLIMWSEDGFALRDDSDVNDTYVVNYSVAQAKRKNTFSALKIASIVAAIAAGVLTAYFGFGISPLKRAKINGSFVAFFAAINKHKLVYISMIVPFALLIVFYYIPIILGFRLSFYDYIPGVKDVFVGFKYFKSVYASTEFWNSSLVMLVFLVADLLKAIIPPIIFAEAICAVKHEKFSLVVRILLFLPGVLPGVATTLVWSQGVFGATSNGLINSIAGIFVPGFAKNWINSSSTATSIGSLIAFGFPWIGSYLIFYGAISGINSSYFEAAKLDGCSWLKRIIKIDLPLIMPQIKYIFVTSFIASVQNYTSIFVIYGTTGGNKGEIKTPALLMYREIINANYGVASVMGVTVFLFLSVATFLNFRMQSDNS